MRIMISDQLSYLITLKNDYVEYNYSTHLVSCFENFIEKGSVLVQMSHGLLGRKLTEKIFDYFSKRYSLQYT